MGACNLVDLPRDNRAVGSRWVFQSQASQRWTNVKIVRTCCQGQLQACGAHYDESFSPVVQFSYTRTLLSFANQNNLHVHQVEVVTAFPNGHLKEEMYMEQPEEYIKPGRKIKSKHLMVSTRGQQNYFIPQK